MDLIKIGKFIASLRKEQGLTQETLGQRIGVTNKTVSRWETGAYLPPADALMAMSALFQVSVNELLSGKRLTQEEYQAAAEENLAQVIRSGPFSLKERIDYYKKKWLADHKITLILMGIGILCIFAAAILRRNLVIAYPGLPLLLLAHMWRNNTMMAYVEQHAFDGTGMD